MIRRGKHTVNFTIIPNEVLNDINLKAEALALLVYLIGKPENWKINAEQLGLRFGWGRDKVYKVLKSLIDAFYVTRKPLIVKGLKRGSEYTVYDKALKRRETPHCLISRTSVETDTYKEQTLLDTTIISNILPKPKKSKRISKLEDFVLTDDLKEYAKKYGKEPHLVFETMKNWLEAKGVQKKDYNATFRQFCLPKKWEEEKGSKDNILRLTPASDADNLKWILTQWQTSSVDFRRSNLMRNHEQSVVRLVKAGKIPEKELQFE